MKITAPKMASQLMARSFHDLHTTEELELYDCQIIDDEFENEQLDHVRISTTHIKNSNLIGSSFSKADFLDVIFENCDLSNVRLDGANIHRAHFKNCKLLGVNFTDVRFGNVTFEHCIGNLSVFAQSKFDKVQFDACDLKQTDFYDCTLKSIAFQQCNINEANLEETKLAGVDFTSCTFETLTVGINSLKSCIVSPQQATLLASLLGLIVKY